MRVYLVILLAAGLALAGVLFGLWWAPFVIGVALGAFDRRTRVALPAGAATGLVAWTIPLAMLHVRYGLGSTAGSLAAIMGFGHQGVLPIVLTVLVGGLLGASGAWLGSAARGLVASRARVDASRNG